ncbi:AMP-binding protein [Maritimibacter sp. DP07]|uniref:3-methylmercaptopropionyl-CoA ligase n=1 Tax=Maritimibacter harenae TaxID=2606218 RepID=A0A845M1T8_9RHOB|nr:long-chain fatty acid--CoA ligase [Maritimibacter harenae]MZR11677.1 AMP-binding protein [Maritimibacter harenae]
MEFQISQGLRRAAQVNPAGIATICGDRRKTWAETYDRVTRLAAGFVAMGVAPGDRVAILSENTDLFFEAYYAIWWCGAVATPINMRLAPAEVAYRLEDAGVRLLMFDDAHVDLVAELPSDLMTGIATIRLAAAPMDGVATSDSLIASHAPAPDAGAGGDDLAFIVYTGGSTGRAKGVMLTHTNICVNGLSAQQTIGYERSSVFLHAGPMSHLADGMSVFGVTLATGTHVFSPRFTVDGCLGLIAEHRVTHLCVVPTMVAMLVEGAENSARDLSSLTQIQFGSSPMPDGTLKRAVALWPDILFLHGYGMTETSPLITMHPLETRRPDVAGDLLRSCGQAVPHLDLRIVDDTGADLPPGEIGELVVRGPTVMKGYWNLPDVTARALRDGWMHTEDAAYMDENGYVYVVDRLKDMIISGGENIYSTEVENALSEIEDVAQVAVIGLPHDKWGEVVHAVITPAPGATPDEASVIAACKARIASYKCPKSVTFRTDPMPLTNAGKIDKKVLREGAKR